MATQIQVVLASPPDHRPRNARKPIVHTLALHLPRCIVITFTYRFTIVYYNSDVKIIQHVMEIHYYGLDNT